MFYTLEIYKQDKRTKAGKRLVGKYIMSVMIWMP